MDFKQIQALIKLVEETNMSEVKIEKKDFKIIIRSQAFAEAKSQAANPPTIISQPMAPMPASVPAPMTSPPSPQVTPTAESPAEPANDDTSTDQSVAVSTNVVTIKSPMIGTFYRSSSPDKPPFVKVGDVIEPGSVICIVEAMKLFNEIEAEISGKVVSVLAENASPVEYDTPLFEIEPI